MSEHQHDWQKTGKVAPHVEWPTKTQGRRQEIAIYVRCRICEQMGYRRPGGKVVFTWSAADACASNEVS